MSTKLLNGSLIKIRETFCLELLFFSQPQAIDGMISNRPTVGWNSILRLNFVSPLTVTSKALGNFKWFLSPHGPEVAYDS